ncbi:MAG: 4-hydroxy-tetrahydrodipicolinate reductase [Flavobacteriales bacterium]|nr:4-hydroxy-tetrahydrodipicolinate reductase [Flavobacteriales bacterium]
MKIALIGYGKMGKAIEEIALAKGHEISLRTDREGFEIDDLKDTDVAIEFSTPSTVAENIKKCADAGVPVVVGTTAWYHQFDEMSNYVKSKNSGLFTATNFSIGVNIFFKINELAANMIQKYGEYDVEVDEIHHTQKLDAPSGTAITTAEKLLANFSRKNNWIHHENGLGHTNNAMDLVVNSYREENVPGTHNVKFFSDIDTIEIKHTAHNRKGFAAGALAAAEWMQGKKGIFSMKDLLNF